MRVALAAEGTYPHQFGGVSVWCDQLIRGLPQHEFIVIPLVASGNEAIRWPLPANVTAMATIPLWGRAPSVPLRARLLELASPAATRAYLAHLVLRQVDWSLRFHPDTPATGRHLRLARLVSADIES